MLLGTASPGWSVPSHTSSGGRSAVVPATARTIPAPWPHWWWRQAMCIHRHEAVNWHERRNPSSRGGFQFQYATWAEVLRRHRLHGWPVDPADASVRQQTYAAWLRWLDAGRRWSDWLPYDHAYECVR